MRELRSFVAGLAIFSAYACSQAKPHGGIAQDSGVRPRAETTDQASVLDRGSAEDAAAQRETIDAAAPVAERSEAGAEDTDAETDEDAAPLCDGSTEVRLLYKVQGGFGSPLTQFTAPLGSTFFFVDGTCHFFVFDGSVHGIRTGTLGKADAARLSTDIAWNRLNSWNSYGTHSDVGCADAPLELLAGPGVAVGCVCGCDPGAPAGLGDAERNAKQWAMRLSQQGDELTTPVSAVAIPGERLDTQYASWPLSRSMDSIANLIMTAADMQLATGPYARFDTETEASALRQLRAKAFDSQTQSVPTTELGKKYDLHLRDELPGKTAQALTRFLNP